jgi:hypothetical protein
MAQLSQTINFPLPVMTANNDLLRVFKASTEYGGITITRAYYTPAGATDAGTSHVLVLMNYGTSGTVAGGTIGTVGGTAAPYAAGRPDAFTLTAANVFVDDGEWVVLKKTQEGADSDIVTNSMLHIEYVQGVISVG